MLPDPPTATPPPISWHYCYFWSKVAILISLRILQVDRAQQVILLTQDPAGSFTYLVS